MTGPDHGYMTALPSTATLTRAELAMIRAEEAFERWCVYLHKDVGGPPLACGDIWLLHSIRMRGDVQNLSELLLYLNRKDVSTLQYSLRKLEQSGLVERMAGRSRREAGYRLTRDGVAVTERYAALRQEVMAVRVAEMPGFEAALAAAADAVERLTGLYDQATQALLNRPMLSA